MVTVELLTDNALINNDGKIDTVVLGVLRVSPDTSWVTMDSKICDIFKVSWLDYMCVCVCSALSALI